MREQRGIVVFENKDLCRLSEHAHILMGQLRTIFFQNKH